MFRNDILPGQTVVCVNHRNSRFLYGETFVVVQVQFYERKEPMIHLCPTVLDSRGLNRFYITEDQFLKTFAPHKRVASFILREKRGTNKIKNMLMDHQNRRFAVKLGVDYPRR